jgi:hypothetical protein
MTTAYTPILKLALPVTGELNGAWGDVVNNNITSMVEQAVAGLATINTWTTASHTLTTADGTTDEARCAILQCSGAPGAAATVICPAASKVYIIKNSVTGGYAVTLKTSAGTGISVPNGSTALLYCDGTNVVSGGGLGGDVVGPASATDNAIARFDGTTGKIIQNSAVTIDDTGNVGIGSSSATNNLNISKNITGGTSANAIGITGAIQSDVTANGILILSSPTVAAGATVTALAHMYMNPGTFTGTVTNQYGIYAENTMTSATNNFGFYGNIGAGTGRWNFYAAGSAANFFNGNVGIGTTTNSGKLDVTGGNVYNNTTATGSTGYYTNNGTVVNAFSSDFNANATYFDVNGNAYFRDVNAGYVTRLAIQSGAISLGAAPGAESLRVTPVASAVNYVEIRGQATTGSPQIYAKGSDTNIFLEYYSKGTGNHLFYTNGEFPSRLQQFVIAHTASAVNYLQVTGGATGATTTLSAQGSDTNVDITLTPKGDGYVVVDSAYSPNLTLTDAATIAWNTGTAGGQVATFTFVSSNRTMGAPTNLKNGGFYALAVIQNAGSNTLTWNAVFKWAGGTAPTLSTAAGAKDYFVFRSDGTNLYQQGISQAVA